MIKSNDVYTALSFAGEVHDMVRAGRSGSLIEYTRATRVEPMALVDMRCTQLPYMEEVMHAGLNIFTAYYLQAVALTVDVGDVNVLKVLDRLNPNRSLTEAAAGGRWAASAKADLESRSVGGLESTDSAASDFIGLPFPSQLSQESGLSDAVKMVNQDSNLSVGKMIEVNVESQQQKASFPVQVRLHANTIRPDIMVDTLVNDKGYRGIKERIHQWRSGEIEFFRDLILASDLIEKHKRNMLEDASGYYRSKTQASRKGFLASILSGNPSVATASSIFVMTTETAKELERKMRGRLSNFRDREKMLKEMLGMMIFVVDPDWEQITIYHRSIENATEVSVKEIRRGNKNGKGPDIAEILEAFRSSKSPTL